MVEDHNLFNDLNKTITSIMMSTPCPVSNPTRMVPFDFLHLHIDQNKLSDYIDAAIPQHSIAVNQDTFYVCDISDLEQTEYNTLVFQIFGASLKSKEKTTQVMNRYFDSHVPYSINQYFGRAVGITRKCPYVHESVLFAPNKGTAKNHADWVGLHHVEDVVRLEEQTLLSIKNYHQLILNLSQTVIDSMIDQSIRIYHAKIQVYKEMESMFNSGTQLNPNSVIKKRYKDTVAKQTIPSPSPFKWTTSLVHSLSSQVLTTIYGEKDPYLVDVMKKFSFMENEEQ